MYLCVIYIFFLFFLISKSLIYNFQIFFCKKNSKNNKLILNNISLNNKYIYINIMILLFLNLIII